MHERLSDEDLDHELRHIAAGLVAEAPPAPTRLPAGPATDSPPPPQRRRLRRYLPAFAAVTVVLVIVAGVVMANGWFGSTGVDQASVAAADRRLILETWPGELLLDGSAVPLETGDISPPAQTGAPQALPGGRHVVVGERYPSVDPDPDRADYLAVVDADGRVELERQVGTPTQWVGLLASTSDEAILLKVKRDSYSGGIYGSYPDGQGQLVAHNLETGQERLLPIPVVPNSRTRTSVAADVNGDRLVLVFPIGHNQCRLTVLDLASQDWSVAGSLPDCSEVRGVQVSPTGQFVAVAYGNLVPGAIELRFAIFDLEQGLVRDDVLLGHNVLCPQFPSCGGADPQLDYLGMAWDDGTSVRVALFDLEAYSDGNRYGSPIPRDAILVQTKTVR